VGSTGLLLVGAREPGTRVVRRTRAGFLEIALPFEPPKHRPVAWLGGGGFRIVGRNGEHWIVDAAGAITRSAITGAKVVAGVDENLVVGVGPQFLEPAGSGWTDVTPKPPRGAKLDFRALLRSTKLVLAIASGPVPTVFVEGSFWQRGPEGWVERDLPGHRAVAATATARGTVYAATKGGALLCITDGVAVVLGPALPERVHALAATALGLLVGSDEGLASWRAGAIAPVAVPGDGPVTDVSAWADVEVCVRGGRTWARRLVGTDFGAWEEVVVPAPPKPTKRRSRG
jgi:hypothetical protein